MHTGDSNMRMLIWRWDVWNGRQNKAIEDKTENMRLPSGVDQH